MPPEPSRRGDAVAAAEAHVRLLRLARGAPAAMSASSGGSVGSAARSDVEQRAGGVAIAERGQLDDGEAARARSVGASSGGGGGTVGVARRRRAVASDRFLQVAHGLVVAAEAGEDAAEREVRARGVGVVGLVGEEALVGDAGFARAAGGLVEARHLERLLRLLVELARLFECAEALAQRRRLGPHAAPLVDVGGALLLGRGGVLQRLADARRLGEVARVEEQAQIARACRRARAPRRRRSSSPRCARRAAARAPRSPSRRASAAASAYLPSAIERLDVHPRGSMIRKRAACVR